MSKTVFAKSRKSLHVVLPNPYTEALSVGKTHKHIDFDLQVSALYEYASQVTRIKTSITHVLNFQKETEICP
jgi:hypothetical protein